MNPAGPVFHLFSSGNPNFIIYMAELRVDEFGMNFWLQCFKHLRYGFHIQYISTFYAKLVWWNNIPEVAEIYRMIFNLNNDRNFKQLWLGQQCVISDKISVKFSIEFWAEFGHVLDALRND